jgi:hypothetical protein
MANFTATSAGFAGIRFTFESATCRIKCISTEVQSEAWLFFIGFLSWKKKRGTHSSANY